MKRFSWRKLAIVIGMMIASVPLLLLSINLVARYKDWSFRDPVLHYPNAVEIEREDIYKGVELLLTTTDDTETVLSYYESYLKDAGWTLEERVGTRMMMTYRILSFGKYLFEDYYWFSHEPVYGLTIELYRQPSGMAYINIRYGRVWHID